LLHNTQPSIDFSCKGIGKNKHPIFLIPPGKERNS
jgi:hypothetical protein